MYQNSIFISDPHGEHEEFFYLMGLAKDKLRQKIDNIFVLGDIYDRGPRPDAIMDYLIEQKARVHFCWGNHDILWMGAALGCLPSIACTLRIAFAYNNFDLLNNYGIKLKPLMEFAAKIYKDDPCDRFKIKVFEENVQPIDKELAAKMHKAVSIIQFKLEEGVLPDDRLLLGKDVYPLRDNNFPSVDKDRPFVLSSEEKKIIEGLRADFFKSELLKKHIDFLINNGSIHKVYNNKLMFHACIPRLYSSPDRLSALCEGIKSLYAKRFATPLFYLMWCYENSPFFGKKKMTTFERFFVEDKTTHKEPLDEYFQNIDDEGFAREILKEFGIEDEDGVIINGHIPVKKGESAIKSGGKRIVLDGGMAKSYQSVTGMKGMVMIENNDGATELLFGKEVY